LRPWEGPAASAGHAPIHPRETDTVRFHHRLAPALLAPALLIGLAAPTRAEEKELTTDQDFVLRSIRADTAEIRMSELALKTTSNPEVKAFAKMMIDDHTQHRKEMIVAARSMKADIPEGVTRDDQDDLDRLEKLSGKAFDAAYVKMIVSSHERVLGMNRKWEKEGANAKIRAAAKKTADAVSDHLAMAKTLKTGS
jgi:putative membrane protein